MSAVVIHVDDRHETSDDAHKDAATVIALESITFVACLAVATSAWLFIPVAANAPSAGALHALAPMFLGGVFSALATVIRPSDLARNYFRSRDDLHRTRVNTLVSLLRSRLDLPDPDAAQPHEQEQPTGGAPPGRAGRVTWRGSTTVAVVGGGYGLAIAVAAVACSVAMGQAPGWWQTLVLFALATGYSASITALFVSSRATAANARNLHSRWANLGPNLVSFSAAMYFGAIVVAIAVSGPSVRAAFLFLILFGPVFVHIATRNSRHVLLMQYRDAQRRASALEPPAMMPVVELGGSDR